VFGIQFYPTPEDVIDRMMASSYITDKVILEPSAGSGNIVSWLTKNGAAEVIACEIDDDLRAILANKCHIVENDFFQLKAEQISHIDFIIMNPPFFTAERHIMHAWDIAPDGAEIIALCNSNSLSRTYTKITEQFKELVKDYGFSESFGNCFKWAERETAVDVSKIHLFKPKKNEQEFEGYFDENEEFEFCETPGMMTYNVIRDIVNRYVACIQEYDNVLESAVKINQFSGPISIDQLTFTCTADSRPIQRKTFKKELQKNAWRYIFAQMNMSKYVTTSVMSDINRFVEQQTQIPFTMKNIYKMFELIVGTHSGRMETVLVEAFDLICSYSSENSTAGEKWKTNSNYKINQNFIIPYMTRVSYSGKMELSYSRDNKMEDVMKALCHLTGNDYNDTTRLYQFIDNNYIEWGKWYSWGFFEIRGYKKGTMHFKFKDVKLWERFNREVARIKGWQLPKQTDRKTSGKEHAKSSQLEVFEF